MDSAEVGRWNLTRLFDEVPYEQVEAVALAPGALQVANEERSCGQRHVELEVLLVHWRISTQPSYLAHHLSTKDARQSTEGYPTMVDLSVEVRVIKNQIVT